jgi:hypothetical protein
MRAARESSRSAAVDQAQASSTTEVTIPPQKIIQMLHGEANAYNETTQTSLGSVAWNRMVNGGGWFDVSTWQAAINGNFQGPDGTTNGISPELDRAASLYRGQVGDIVGGAGCFWSPTNSEWTNIGNAWATNSTTFPSNSGAPSCYGSSSTGRQILVKTGVENNHRPGYTNAPAFVFLRPRPASGDPAVIGY